LGGVFNMEFSEFVSLLQRRFGLILTSIAICFAWSFQQTSNAIPIYESTVTVFVATPPSIADSIAGSQSKIGELTTGNTFGQARVKSYASIVNNSSTLEPVVQELGLTYSTEELAESIKSVAVADTVLIQISVQNPDPKLAAEIANSVAKHFSETIQTIELNSTLDLSQLIRASIVKEAVPNFTAVYPRKFFNYVLGIFVGSLLGFGVSLLLKLMDKSLKNEGDIGSTSLLGVIAFDQSAKDFPLTTELDTYHPRTEAFRVIRTNILHELDKNEIQSFLVTSCFAAEGKSTSSLNIGYAISLSGYSVLVIEADMRRPSFKNYAQKLAKDMTETNKSDHGLSTILNNSTAKLTKKILNEHLNQTKFANLWIMPSGPTPSNPAELLGTERFESLIQLAESEFDYVIIDTPPALSVADATVVARVVPKVALVIHAGKTSKNNFQALQSALGDVDVALMGAILNKVPKHKRGERYGYTYSSRQSGYYRYSYDYDSNYGAHSSSNVSKTKILQKKLAKIFVAKGTGTSEE
jgi:polysaccharide biosynthesis transport protein